MLDLFDKDENKLSELTCHLQVHRFSYGAGRLIATNKRLIFSGNTKARGETLKEFAYEGLKTIRYFHSKGLFKKFFNSQPSFMYRGEEYTLNLVVAANSEIENFITVVNKQITEVNKK
ncbi:PH domain-containing protein [Aquibacillus rhizosphaerae]|uniref:PH domain-containing protein n=1 Tax=Aquibacillus rhizosphaerae TaxID=3051431 RepID=A0ABT7L4D0_9BACI|nr:PH domain-containing protein [Aquibacillus sp. LR5S19]MDL4839451.1 PH domain-containing protein [Aquibacillus sp. LR5S19]